MRNLLEANRLVGTTGAYISGGRVTAGAEVTGTDTSDGGVVMDGRGHVRELVHLEVLVGQETCPRRWAKENI